MGIKDELTQMSEEELDDIIELIEKEKEKKYKTI